MSGRPEDRPPAMAPTRPNTLASDVQRPPGSARPRPVPNRLAGLREAGTRASLPGVSGRSSAIALVAIMVATAVVLPLALHRSTWVEAELVMLAWFLAWTAVLTWLGYSGRVVEQDWGGFRRPRRLFDWDKKSDRRSSLADATDAGSRGVGGTGGADGADGVDGVDGVDGLGGVDGLAFVNFGDLPLPDLDVGGDDSGLGCLGLLLAGIVVIGAAAAIIVLLYFTIGYAIPLIAIGLYTLVRAMLNQVAARGHVTRGSLIASAARGAAWAAVYTAPIAVAIWVVHVAL